MARSSAAQGYSLPDLVLGENTVDPGTGARRQGQQKRGAGACTLRKEKATCSVSPLEATCPKIIARANLTKRCVCARGTELSASLTLELLTTSDDVGTFIFITPVFHMKKVKL